MRWLPVLVLLLLGPPAAAQPPQKLPTLVPAFRVAVRLDALLATEPMKGLRAAVETDLPYFTADVEREFAAKPLDFVRLSAVMFAEQPAGKYPEPHPVVVRTLRTPVNEAAFIAAVGGKVEAERGQLPGQPDVRLIRGRHEVHGMVGNQILSIHFPPFPEARPLLGELFAEARRWDAEAEKASAVLSLKANGNGVGLLIGERDRKEMPPPLLAMLAAGAGELTVHLRTGGTVPGVTQTPALLLRGTVMFADEKAATTATEAARELLQMAGGVVPVWRAEAAKEFDRTFDPLFDLMAAALKAARVTTDGKTAALTASADLTPAMTAGLAAAPKRMEAAAVRAVSVNNLKQIGLAMHNHESAFNHLPDNIYAKDGKPLLSWRVAVLPYLEEEPLYKEFRLDEPWDSEHNRKLLPRMPKVYAVPGTKADPGRTFYQSFIGKKKVVPTALFVEGGMKRSIVSITDGTSNTLLAVEASEAVEWTKPADLPFAPNGPLPKLGGHHGRPGFNAVFADGHTRFLPTDLPADKLKALITSDGGEVIELP